MADADPTAPAPADVPADDAVLPPVAPGNDEEGRRRRRLAVILLLLLLLLLLLGVLTGWYLLFRKPLNTLVPPLGHDATPQYLYSVYGASKPVGIAVEPDGERMYVVESGGAQVVKVYSGTGEEIGVLEAPDAAAGRAPVYVAVNPEDETVWVSDRATGRLDVFDATGAFVRSFTPTEPIPNWQPIGVAFSPDGDLWVTDLSAPYHRIEVFGLDGTLKEEIGAIGQFDFPNRIAFDAQGRVYVSSSNAGRVVVLDPATGAEIAGISRGAAAGALGLPRGIAVDDEEILYVVDATGQTVHRYRTGSDTDPRPVFIDQFGTDGIEDGQFEYPNDVAVDERARVYVTDRENDRVQVWGY